MPELIVDIKEIERLSEEHEYENVEFRSYLKGYDIELDEFDSIVHSFHDDISAKIDCTKCANCCKTMTVVLDDDDLSLIAKGLGISLEEVRANYTSRDEESNECIIDKKPCPFLKDNKCSIYQYRPKVCRSFPHLHKEGIMFRLWGIIGNASVCPIAFNVFEQMKRRFL